MRRHIEWALLASAIAICLCNAGCQKKSGPLDDALSAIESTDKEARIQGFERLGSMLNRDEVTDAMASPQASRVVAAYQWRHSLLLPQQSDAPACCGSWVMADAYRQLRIEAELLLDLLGFVRSAQATQSLRLAMTLRDRHLKSFALRSLIRLREAPDPAAVEDTAQGDEDRNDVYEALAAAGQTALFPSRLATQESFARSELVRWLTAPTALDCEPTEIELAKVVPMDEADLFLFRFRTTDPTHPKPGVWLAGLAGPFPRGQATPKSLRPPYSDFQPWDDATPDEHIARIAKRLAR